MYLDHGPKAVKLRVCSKAGRFTIHYGSIWVCFKFALGSFRNLIKRVPGVHTNQVELVWHENFEHVSNVFSSHSWYEEIYLDILAGIFGTRREPAIHHRWESRTTENLTSQTEMVVSYTQKSGPLVTSWSIAMFHPENHWDPYRIAQPFQGSQLWKVMSINFTKVCRLISKLLHNKTTADFPFILKF